MQNYLDLFSGIGGWSLGARWAGMEFENHLYSEVDEYAIKVMEKNFPTATNLGDIKQIDGTKLKENYAGDWVLSGSFPCQDLSTAGNGGGLNAERSGLWFEYARLIRELQPKWVTLENVPQLLNSGWERCLSFFSEIGMDVQWDVISAANIGAPHLRKRCWAIAYPNEAGIRTALFDAASQKIAELGNDNKSDHTIKGCGTWASWKRASEEKRRNVCRANIYRMDARLPQKLDKDRLRNSALGNTIMPQIAYAIWASIKDANDKLNLR